MIPLSSNTNDILCIMSLSNAELDARLEEIRKFEELAEIYVNNFDDENFSVEFYQTRGMVKYEIERRRKLSSHACLENISSAKRLLNELETLVLRMNVITQEHPMHYDYDDDIPF